MRIEKLLVLLIFIQVNLKGQDRNGPSEISIAETFEIRSEILNETREIQIYQPQGLWGMDEIKTNLPVIFVLDGESQFNHTATTVDFLSIATNGNDFMPRSIVVGIPNTNRVRDLTPIKDVDFAQSGGGGNFLNFITEELIPYIDSSYHTSSHRTIIGHSLGGLMVFESLLKKRQYFDNYIAIDPGFGFSNESYLEEILDTLKQADLSQENIFFAGANNRPEFVSREEILQDTSKLLKAIDIPNRKFVLAADSEDWSINLTTAYYSMENHYSVPHKATADGLRDLYTYYTYPEMTNYYHPLYKDRDDLVSGIKAHYKMISLRMGYKVLPMQGYINSFAFGLDHYDRGDLAVDLLRYNIELHPNDTNMYNNLAYYYRSKGKDEAAVKAFTQSLKLKDNDHIAETRDELIKKMESFKKE